MPRLPPVSHAQLVAGLRRHGFEGPYAGGKHLFMLKGELRLTIPNPHSQDIVAAVVDISRSIGAEVVAEGIETQQQFDMVAQLGCDHVQGFGIARPMPFEQTLDWIARHTAKLQEVPRIMNGKAT